MSKPVVLKAHKGNRSKNLIGIADQLDDLAGEVPSMDGDDQIHPVGRTMRGLAEQLRIIAAEIQPFYTRG